MRICIVSILLALWLYSPETEAQSWDYIRTSNEYYYGVGTGKTEYEANKAALQELVQMIAVHVASNFQMEAVDKTSNGELDHNTFVRNCMSTYSSASLTNVHKYDVQGKEPEVTVRCYMPRSELEKIYEKRKEKVQDMVYIAEEAQQKAKVDMALQYYYWAYSLLRSLQHPSEVKDASGRSLVTMLPIKIREILEDISVQFEKRENDCVDLLFKYRGIPVSSLDFQYNDGRQDGCDGRAKDGRGMIEMIPGYTPEYYHLTIEYEFKNLSRNDDELNAVLNTIPRSVFSEACLDIKATGNGGMLVSAGTSKKTGEKVSARKEFTIAEPTLQPKESQTVDDDLVYGKVMDKVIEAIRTRNYSNANQCFTIEGLEIYNKLISYGAGRIVGTPNMIYFKAHKGNVVARGLQMSFSFNNPRKTTFVEDVVFTFDQNKKICNLAFGLGKVATADIMTKYAPGWKDETRELIMEFLENYKTAYSLKRIDFIRDMFADDAVIIVGNVVKRNLLKSPERHDISSEGRDIIKYNRYDKNTYIKNVERTFNNNEFINIRFTNNDVQWLDKYEDEEIYGIQIGQEYTSTRYADKGYLFLLVDMTDHDAPQIKVRTWQPNEVSMSNIFSAGHFYNK